MTSLLLTFLLTVASVAHAQTYVNQVDVDLPGGSIVLYGCWTELGGSAGWLAASCEGWLSMAPAHALNATQPLIAFSADSPGYAHASEDGACVLVDSWAAPEQVYEVNCGEVIFRDGGY